jgi:hypothetical protein
MYIRNLYEFNVNNIILCLSSEASVLFDQYGEFRPHFQPLSLCYLLLRVTIRSHLNGKFVLRLMDALRYK